MTSKAAEVTGIYVINGKMYCHGKEVNAVKLSAAADALLKIFMKFQSKVVLIGHNIKSFDFHLLLNALESCSKTDAFYTVLQDLLTPGSCSKFLIQT